MPSRTAHPANAEQPRTSSSEALHTLVLRLVAASVDGPLEEGLIGLVEPEADSAFISSMPEALNKSTQTSRVSANDDLIIDSSLRREQQSQIAQCIRDAQESNLIDPLLNPDAVAQFLRSLGLGISILASANPESRIMHDSRWSAVWERVLDSLRPRDSSSLRQT